MGGAAEKKNMAAPRNVGGRPSLETQPWSVFSIGCKNFLVKGIFDADSYAIMATDLGAVWEETVKEADLVKRWKVRPCSL